MAAPLICQHCHEDGEPFLQWHPDNQHLGAYCRRCLRWIKWLKQDEATLAEAPSKNEQPSLGL